MSAEQERTPQRQLGELMTELGLISEEQLATVLEVQQQSKRPLGQIIVELGFASGAAVAHALAMQSGGALRTEYGFALGVHPTDAEADDEETRAGLPKLRLAPTAVAPTTRSDAATPETDDSAASPAEAEAVDETEPVESADPAEEAEAASESELVADDEPV